jgi:putative methyltransferase
MNRRRFKELNGNLKSAGVTCAQTFNGDFLSLPLPFDEIDYILLDPSCSGSGIRNRDDDVDVIDEERLTRLATLQIRMVTYALTNFPKVKRITYSTCSIHSQENEEVVETILDQFADEYQVWETTLSPRNDLYFMDWFRFSWLIFYRTGQVEGKPNEHVHVYAPHPMTH